MSIKKIRAVYFSATGTTKKIAETIANTTADSLNIDYEMVDFTLPAARESPLRFMKDDLVIFGTPVYAGRVPNVLLKFLDTIEGGGALSVPVVLYGNRNYDDALIELRDILEKRKLHTIAAAAFIGEHSFSYSLAKGRPDITDIITAKKFADEIVKKLERIKDSSLLEPIPVKGTPAPYSGYYTPRDSEGNAVDIRKVKPVTSDDCIDCMICVKVCPMGSISYENVREYTGICIKCGACIKKCLAHAKFYNDKAYNYHKNELEEKFKRRAEPELFL